MNNDILLVSEYHCAFAAVQRDQTSHPIIDDEGNMTSTTQYGQYEQLALPTELFRQEANCTAYLINTTPHTLQLTYLLSTPGQHDLPVGPTHDYIHPMEAREIGASPNRMIWRIEKAGN